MYLLDSNILIYYLEGHKEVRRFVETRKNTRPYISVISITELLAKAEPSKKQLEFLHSFLDRFPVLDFVIKTAKEAARMKRTYHLLFPDAVIAATAMSHHLTLVTRDKHIGKIRKLKTIDPFSPEKPQK